MAGDAESSGARDRGADGDGAHGLYGIFEDVREGALDVREMTAVGAEIDPVVIPEYCCFYCGGPDIDPQSVSRTAHESILTYLKKKNR
jgi:hypothetical protein